MPSSSALAQLQNRWHPQVGSARTGTPLLTHGGGSTGATTANIVMHLGDQQQLVGAGTLEETIVLNDPAGSALLISSTATLHSTWPISLAGTSTLILGSVIEGPFDQSSLRLALTPLSSPSSMLESTVGTSLRALVPMSKLKARATTILATAEHEDFEFGVDSALARGIASVVAEHGTRALHALQDVLQARQPGVEVLGEFLREIGRVPHPASRDLRRELLVRYLQSPTVQVRHMATTGLAELRDRLATKYLEAAYQVEQSQRLKRHIARTIDYLRSAR